MTNDKNTCEDTSTFLLRSSQHCRSCATVLAALDQEDIKKLDSSARVRIAKRLHNLIDHEALRKKRKKQTLAVSDVALILAALEQKDISRARFLLLASRKDGIL